MIELRTLGALSLIDSGGRDLSPILRQPKRLGLLTYLAVASPRGFQRRDTLLALFWPERDSEHARAALSDSLYALRRTLGRDVVISRGDEEVGVAGDGLWCDAVTVAETLATGRRAEALDLYRGDFLAGFHLPETPEFERWLEAVRARLRDQVTRAASDLAGQEAAAGRPMVAVRWARQAVSLSPYDENGLRRLLNLLDGMGSRAEAVVEYERFARGLASDLELQPSPETVALVESIRERGSGEVGRKSEPWVGPAARVVDVSPAPIITPTPSLEARAGSRLWNRRLAVTALTAAALAAIGLGIRSSLPRRPVASAVVAVLPFSYRGRPEFSYLADGMVNLLSVKLDGASSIRPVDPQGLLRYVGSGGGGDDPEHAARVARHFGAGLFVLGSITEAGGRLDVSATLYDSVQRPRRSFEATAAREAEIFEVADRLARNILAEAQDQPLVLARAASQSTNSLPALKAYLEAERENRAGRGTLAVEALIHAVDLDTSFALAYYRLAELSSRDDAAFARRVMEHALRHDDRLDDHHRWLVLALADFLDGAHTAALQRYREIVASHPDDAEAWFMLGQITMAKRHLLGRPLGDAREAFERVLALDPSNAVAMWWLTAIATKEQRRRDLDSLTDRLLRLHPSPFIVAVAKGQQAIVTGDTAGLNAYLAELRSREDGWAQPSAGIVTYTTQNLAVGRRLWGVITEPSRSAEMRLLARTVLAKIELTGGRRTAAWAELDSARVLDAGTALEYRAGFGVTRFVSLPPAELARLRDSLQRWTAPTDPGADPAIRLYLLGLLSARLGDTAAAIRFATQLERSPRSTPTGRFAADEAKAVRGEVAWLGGRRDEALRTLESAGFWTNDSGLEEKGDSPFTTHLHERFARAELLYELGREDEALRWFDPLAGDFLYTGLAELREAQIYQHRGARPQARAHYSRFVELWSDCDPELRPRVREAETALIALR